MIQIEYDPDRAYGDAIVKDRKFVFEQYMAVPVVAWLHHNIGPLLTKDLGEITHGEGWEIFADWNNYDWQTARTYVIITKDVDPQLITKFWMKFGK